MFAWSLSVGDGVGIHGGRASSLAKFPSVYPFWWIRTCLLVIEEKQVKNWEKKPKIYRGASFPLKRLGKPPGQTEELKALPCENNGCRWHRGWGLLILMSLVSVRSECPWGPLSQSRSTANDVYTVTLGPGAGRAYCAGMTRATAAFFFFFLERLRWQGSVGVEWNAPTPFSPWILLFLVWDFAECEDFQENLPHCSRNACVSLCCKMSVHLKIFMLLQSGAPQWRQQEEPLVTSPISASFLSTFTELSRLFYFLAV